MAQQQILDGATKICCAIYALKVLLRHLIFVAPSMHCCFSHRYTRKTMKTIKKSSGAVVGISSTPLSHTDTSIYFFFEDRQTLQQAQCSFYGVYLVRFYHRFGLLLFSIYEKVSIYHIKKVRCDLQFECLGRGSQSNMSCMWCTMSWSWTT